MQPVSNATKHAASVKLWKTYSMSFKRGKTWIQRQAWGNMSPVVTGVKNGK